MRLNISLLVILVQVVGFSVAAARVVVDVYYESLCPDSRDFIVKQLKPALEKPDGLAQLVTLNLLPYGKSSYIRKPNNEGFEFTCHHGPDECLGNKMHACARNLIDNGSNTTGFGYNRQLLGFVECMMANVDRNTQPATFPVEDCSKKNGVTVDIRKCANSPEGVDALIQVASETTRFQAPLLNVPTIVINGNYTSEMSKKAEKGLIGEICSAIPPAERPSDCSSARNLATGSNFSLILLVIGALALRWQ